MTLDTPTPLTDREIDSINANAQVDGEGSSTIADEDLEALCARAKDANQLERSLAAAQADAVKYRQLATPEIRDFMLAVEREAAHQRDRWGVDHDGGKTPEDWLWLVAYLATKATQANRYGDADKYLHHIITCAAACCNWHANATGESTSMRPGVDPDKHAALAPQEGERDE